MRCKIRPLQYEDICDTVEVEKAAWSPPWPQKYVFGYEHIKSQIDTFPEGILGAFVDNGIVGFVTTEIIDYNLSVPIPTWDDATDCGFIRKTHKDKGNVLYGVNLSVHPKYARTRIAEQLLYAVGRIAVCRNIQYIVLGSRIPRYHKYSDTLSAEEYVFSSRPNSGKPLDPELYLYLKEGLKVIKVLPNYIEDPESLNYGVILIWKNPFYVFTRYLPFLARIFSLFIR